MGGRTSIKVVLPAVWESDEQLWRHDTAAMVMIWMHWLSLQTISTYARRRLLIGYVTSQRPLHRRILADDFVVDQWPVFSDVCLSNKTLSHNGQVPRDSIFC